MKLAEIAFFTENVSGMTNFYRRLLGIEPMAHSETMAIFFTGETKIFYWGRSAYLRDPNGHQIEIMQIQR